MKVQKYFVRWWPVALVLVFLAGCVPLEAPPAALNAEAGPESVTDEDKIANAMSAGPPAIAQEATILDLPEGFPGKWPDEPLEGEMIELRAGSNGWTCIVDRPNTPGNDPMCLNETYLEVLKAQHALIDAPSSGIGIGYMLQEGGPAGSPPHMMFFAPRSKGDLSAFTTEPGPTPWVMFPETTYAHLMLTQVPRPEAVSASEDKIANAMSAGPSAVAEEATILDYPEGYPGNWPDEPLNMELIELHAGTNGWTCIVDIPDTPGNDPMCLNETYLEALKARHALTDAPSSGIGIGYMLQEGGPAGTPPHMMVFVPASNDGLTAFTTEPGPSPWVMFPDTTYAHVMLTFFYDVSSDEQTLELSDQLGSVDFPISCNVEAQTEFNHGVTLLHSFFFPRALASFEKVVELDPSCAMGHWGMAMTHLGIPWSPTPPEAVAAGTAAVEAALAAGAPTEREQAYINAVALLYKDADTVDFRARIEAYEVAMAQLAQDFPEDVEAQAFYSLALNMTGLPAAEGFPKQLKATEVAQPIFAAFPNHPGAAHYLIHSHDFPPLAEGGLEPALVYAKIAPAAPHAQHMPSHIFTRLGYWQESIDSNTVGVAANKAALAESHPLGTAFEGALHGTDYMMYAHLNLGQDEAALAFIDEVNSIERVLGGFGAAYALAAMPARYVMERGAWDEGTALTLHPQSFPWENFPQAEAIMVFGRGVSTARAGNVKAARDELARLQELQEAMNAANQGYWARRADIQIGAVTAWIALVEGKGDEALAAMRGAAELDAVSSTHPVSPGNLVPAHELLGEMLLELEQPAEALAAFEISMEKDPNRFRSLYGAGHAAELAGDVAKAQTYYEELVNLAANADGERPEVIEAQAFLAQ